MLVLGVFQVIAKVAKGTKADVDWAVDCAHVSKMSTFLVHEAQWCFVGSVTASLPIKCMEFCDIVRACDVHMYPPGQCCFLL